MIDFDKLLTIIETAGKVGPAFFDLAELAIATFTGGSQDTLRDALATARLRSDELHHDVQDALADAAKT